MSNAIQQVQANQQKSALATFAGYLDARKGQIAQVLPKHLTPERVTKVAISAAMKTPDLLKCSIESVYLAVHQAAQLGLEPGGPLGHAYLVPYGGACTLIVGYRGLIDLARRSGQIACIEAHVVHAQDTFDVCFGLTGRLEHKPYLGEGEPGPALFVYAIATLRDGSKQFEVMTRADVERIRNRSRAGRSGPWQTDWEEMARKTVVRRLCKYLPLSVELATALEMDGDNEAERSNLEPLPTVDVAARVIDEAQPTEAGDVTVESAPVVEPAPQTQTERVRETIRAQRSGTHG